MPKHLNKSVTAITIFILPSGCLYKCCTNKKVQEIQPLKDLYSMMFKSSNEKIIIINIDILWHFSSYCL